MCFKQVVLHCPLVNTKLGLKQYYSIYRQKRRTLMLMLTFSISSLSKILVYKKFWLKDVLYIFLHYCILWGRITLHLFPKTSLIADSSRRCFFFCILTSSLVLVGPGCSINDSSSTQTFINRLAGRLRQGM